MRVSRYIGIGLFALVVLTVSGLGWRCLKGLEYGKRYAVQLRFGPARDEILRYLKLRPHDDEANMLLAECFVRDDRLPPRESAGSAIESLSKIDRTSPASMEARIKSARLRLFILKQPHSAEAELQSVLLDAPDSFEANYLEWKLLDLTKRYQEVEPYFSRCFLSADASRHYDLLLEWYYSQFSTFSAATQLDQLMGFSDGGAPADALSEFRRLKSFIENEPDSALNKALLLSWQHEYHVSEGKWDLVDEVWSLADADSPGYVYAVLFDVLLQEGKFAEAKEVFESWPPPRDGFDFRKREGLCFSEIDSDDQSAIESFKLAASLWPGQVDWQLHHRMANLLTRLGKTEEATRIRTEATRLEKLMDVELHDKIRKILATGSRQEICERMASFYRDLNRPLETDAWQKLAGR